jgi:peptidoglycan/LPS O-acetylase OafA/YrhL
MPIELLGSFVVFGTLALFGRLRNRWLAYAALCVGVDFVNPFLIGFVLGVALCDVWIWNRRGPNWEVPLVAGIALLGIGWFCVQWKAVQGLCIVAAIAATPALQRFLSSPRLAWLGRASFGLYLIHSPIMGSLGCRFYVLLREFGALSHDGAGLAACVLTLTVSIVAALAFDRFIDRPTLAVSKAFDEWLFRPLPSILVADADPVRRAA